MRDENIMWILLLLCLVQTGSVQGKIVGAFVLPHGGIAFDPVNFNTTNHTARQEAFDLNEACFKTGNDITGVNPDVVFLSTPHGLADYRNFLVYSNSIAAGYGVADDCLIQPCQYNLSVQLESQIAAAVFKQFGYDRNVSTLSAFGPVGNDNPIPLRWGEVIPLLFAPNVSATAKIVVLSQPTRRYNESVGMIPELVQLGQDLYKLLEAAPERVVVLISADLAHTHSADGPYGYSNASQPFDDAIGKWANTLEYRFLLEAAGLVDRALSCGFTGLVMLHGMFMQSGTSLWQPTVYANLHPSYYGMMAASFQRSLKMNQITEIKS